jgi:hypothetical protein
MKPIWFKREIIHTPTGPEEIDAVMHVQRVLRCPETGLMDDSTRMHIRGMQVLFNLQPTGSINEETATEIDRLVAPGAW